MARQTSSPEAHTVEYVDFVNANGVTHLVHPETGVCRTCGDPDHLPEVRLARVLYRIFDALGLTPAQTA